MTDPFRILSIGPDTEERLGRWTRALRPTVLALALAVVFFAPMSLRADTVDLYVGTYTWNDSEGIYHLTMDVESGALGPAELVAELDNPTWVQMHPVLDRLYAVTEERDPGEGRGSHVVAFAIGEDGRLAGLTPLARVPASGAGACHLAISGESGLLLTANYSSGSVGAIPLREDGRPEGRYGSIQHSGSGPHERRQKGPHAHFVGFTPDEAFVLAVDLGTDEVYAYRHDREAATLAVPAVAVYRASPGAGPRHLAISPDGRTVYVLNELDGTLDVVAFDRAAPAFEHLQTIPLLDRPWENRFKAAAISISGDGRFVYASGRGSDTVSVFRVAEGGTSLERVQVIGSGGQWPRFIGLDPSGGFLVAANRNSGNLVVFAVDPQTGELSPTGHEAKVPLPTGAAFR